MTVDNGAESFAHNVRTVADNLHAAILDIPDHVWALRETTDFTQLSEAERDDYRALQVCADLVSALTHLATGLGMHDPTLRANVIRYGLAVVAAPRLQHLAACTGPTATEPETEDLP